MALKPEDLNRMQTYGRMAAHWGDHKAIKSAAEYLAIATPTEKQTLRACFEKGVSAYGYTQAVVNKLMQLVDDVTQKELTGVFPIHR